MNAPIQYNLTRFDAQSRTAVVQILRRHRFEDRAYVLIVVLIVLTMSTTLMALVAQVAIGQSRAAATAEAALQRKWAQLSIKQAVLPQAETLLRQAETVSDTPVSRIDKQLQLGAMTVAMAVCDEQAKANVNQMLERGDDEAVANRMRTAWAGSGLINTVRLRPLTASLDEAGRIGPPRLIQSFGQIFERITPLQLLDLGSPATQITCWGDGGINLLRADEAALRLALFPSLTRIEIHQVIKARAKRFKGVKPMEASATPRGGDPIQALLDAAKVAPRDRAQLAITDHSTCHSVWIVVKDRQRVWYTQDVLDESMPQRPLRAQFQW